VAATALAAPPGPPLVLTSFARLVAILCIAVGIGALVAWWLGKPLFSSLLPVSGTMKPNTALCFFLGGASLAGLLAHSRRATGGALTRCLAWAQPAAALLLLLIASTTLLSYVLHLPEGIDRLLVPDDSPNHLRVYPWRMSPISAISFSLLAIAMLPWPPRSRLWLVMELIVLLISVCAFIMVVGYAYQAASLYSLPGFSVVALHTALGLLLLTTAVLTIHPRFMLAAQIMAPDQAGAEMRRLLPAAVLLPCVVGWLLLQGQRRGWYDREIGLAMFTAANMLVFSTLVWWNAQVVRRSEAALLAHLRRVQAVTELDRAILGMRSMREVAAQALDHLQRLVPCACVTLVVFDRNSGAHRMTTAGTCSEKTFVPRAHSIAVYEQALRDAGTGPAILLGDLGAVRSDSQLFRELRKEGAVSYAGLPLRGEQHLLGMLELSDPRPNCFTHEHIQAAHSIADQLAIALQQALLREDIDRHTASLERRVQERTRELQAMNQELTYANRDLEEFTASAAHDLRAPLNAMTGDRSLDPAHERRDRRHARAGAAHQDRAGTPPGGSRCGRRRGRAGTAAAISVASRALSDRLRSAAARRSAPDPEPAGQPARQRLEIYDADRAAHGGAAARRGQVDANVRGPRQRCGFRHELRPAPVRAVPAHAHHGRISRRGHRPRHGCTHRATLRRKDLGGKQGGPGLGLLFHATPGCRDHRR